jgi:hypothetical protein
MEMRWLQTIPWWDVLVPKPHTFCDSHVLIHFFNTRSLPLHKNDVFSNYNIKTTHIFVLQWNTFNTLTSNNTSLNIDTRTHSMINVNDRNGTMIIYNNFTTLSSHETFTSLGVEYITITFNAHTRKAIHIITIYIPSTLSLSMFIIHLQTLLDLMPISCLMIIIDDFNIWTCLIKIQYNQMNSKVLWTNIQWNFNFKKLRQFMDPILITFGQMHPLNNAC